MIVLPSFNPRVIAHRGASGYAPENTIAAFQKAAELGAKWVEFDVMQSKDGEPIIFHDDDLDRTTNGSGALIDHDWVDLRKLDAGAWFDPAFQGERIPTLIETFSFLKQNCMAANVEIKSYPGKDEELVIKVLTQMNRFDLDKKLNLLFSSFSFEALYALRKHSSDCQIGILLHEWEPNWEAVVEKVGCVSVHVNEAILTEKSAKKIKQMGKILLSYTVNHPARAAELFSWGVDAVFSDVPDKIMAITI